MQWWGCENLHSKIIACVCVCLWFYRASSFLCPEKASFFLCLFILCRCFHPDYCTLSGITFHYYWQSISVFWHRHCDRIKVDQSTLVFLSLGIALYVVSTTQPKSCYFCVVVAILIPFNLICLFPLLRRSILKRTESEQLLWFIHFLVVFPVPVSESWKKPKQASGNWSSSSWMLMRRAMLLKQEVANRRLKSVDLNRHLLHRRRQQRRLRESLQRFKDRTLPWLRVLCNYGKLMLGKRLGNRSKFWFIFTAKKISFITPPKRGNTCCLWWHFLVMFCWRKRAWVSFSPMFFWIVFHESF